MQVYFLLGRLYLGTANYPKAVGALNEALEINPFHPGVYQALRQVYEAEGKETEAKKIQDTLEKLRG